jgi:hypothetical protein
MKSKYFNSEADLVDAFSTVMSTWKGWVIYNEIQGFDLVLANEETGLQIGVEAKLELNAKVICQALEGISNSWAQTGPDYRAVLVPFDAQRPDLVPLCGYCGVTILTVHPNQTYRFVDGGYREVQDGWKCNTYLPSQAGREFSDRGWYPWLPTERMKLPDYIPDVRAGVKSPLQLTPWKISAIKLMILLEKRGWVTRRDIQALQMSPTMWCQPFGGYLKPSEKKRAYIAGPRTPDFRSQHPRNYAEIEADWPTWSVGLEDLPAV